MCPSLWFGVFKPSFSKFSEHPKYPKTGITPTSDSLVTGLRSHLLGRVKLKILDSFKCVLADDLK